MGMRVIRNKRSSLVLVLTTTAAKIMSHSVVRGLASRHAIETHSFWNTPIASTQDEARRLLQARGDMGTTTHTPLAVLSNAQTHGRGTQGRQWETAATAVVSDNERNLYLTLCLPYDAIPTRITLLPLQVGIVVAQQATNVLRAHQSSAPTVTVKWPNDCLIHDKKLAGILIENEHGHDDDTWLLIGVGINVGSAPDLTRSPGQQRRAATCLQEHVHTALPPDTVECLGTNIVSSLVDWALDAHDDVVATELRVVDTYRALSQFDTPYEVRADHVDQEHPTYRGEQVTTLGITNDGLLRVRGANGQERLLMADYLF